MAFEFSPEGGTGAERRCDNALSASRNPTTKADNGLGEACRVQLPVAVAELTAGTLRVWRVDHVISDDAVIHETLTEADRAEFSHIKHAGMRARGLATRSLLRKALSEFVGGSVHWREWTFTRDGYGRPMLGPGLPQLSFSCSHTVSVSLIAISSGGEVGVDVESCQCGYDEELVSGFLSARERRQLRCLPDGLRPEAFARLWTLKEAYLKAFGGRLSEEIGSVEFDVIADSAIIVPAFGTDSGLKLAAWQIASSGGHISAALAMTSV